MNRNDYIILIFYQYLMGILLFKMFLEVGKKMLKFIKLCEKFICEYFHKFWMNYYYSAPNK